MSHNLVPRGCYPYNEWEVSFTEDDGTVYYESVVEYYYSNGTPCGVLIDLYVNNEFVKQEFVKYDPAL